MYLEMHTKSAIFVRFALPAKTKTVTFLLGQSYYETTWTSIWRQSSKARPEPTFAVNLGKCTTRLQDKMHDDPQCQWETVDKNQKPLETWALLPNREVVMKQTGEMNISKCNLVENLLAVLTMKQQNSQSNMQWYKKFSTRVDVAESVGVQFDIFRCMCILLLGVISAYRQQQQYIHPSTKM